MTNTWLDPDGLYRKYGTTKAVPNVAGEYKTYGELREIEIKLDLTKVTATDGSYIVSDQVFFPKNVRIEAITVSTDVAGTGTGAVLNLGLVKTDRATEIDYNGFLAAFPLTSMDSAGETTTITAGGTYAGALIGTVNSTFDGYITADYDTAAFTAGSVFIRIKYNIA